MRWLKQRATQIAYRVSGLPLSLRHFRRAQSNSPAAFLRHVYARRYWKARSWTETLELVLALLVLPFFILCAAIWHSARIGPGYARRSGRPVLLQLADQVRLYAATGVMPGSYYVFSLYEQPTAERARSFLMRSETKGMLYRLVRKRVRPVSSLSDKAKFEERCRAHGLPVVPTLGLAQEGRLVGLDALPEQDLFIKPLNGKGGRGAERWRHLGSGRYSGRDAELSGEELRAHIGRQSQREPLIIQPRIANHPSLAGLNSDALSTVRVLTCLDTVGRPELIGAALRMAIDRASAVDNFHGGGIAAAIDADTGELGQATNLGKDPRIGWLDEHPVTGARIAGHRLDWWGSLKALALDAHRAFSDRLFVGWDITMTPQGPMIIEANGSPDLDILQRTMRRGMAESRFAELLAQRLS